MQKNIIGYIFKGVGVFVLGFFISFILGELWLGRQQEQVVQVLSVIFISILFLAAVMVVCTLLIINSKKDEK